MGASRLEVSTRAIALTGFMGAGKSAVGRRLAVSLGRDFHDTDAEIVRRTGEGIVEMFSSGEESLFRDEEAAIVRELVALRPPTVIALGGGALERAATLELVRLECVLVHLAISWDEVRTALPRLVAGRPLLAGKSEEQIHQLFVERQASYASAHVRVDLTYSNVRAATLAVAVKLGIDLRRGGARRTGVNG